MLVGPDGEAGGCPGGRPGHWSGTSETLVGLVSQIRDRELATGLDAR